MSSLSSGDGLENGEGEEEPSVAEGGPAEMAERIRTLSRENQRLREEYARSRRARYRRMAIGFAATGLLSTLGGVLFPGARDVLFSLGGTGLFVGVLTYYLTPETFIPVTIGRGVYATAAANQARLAAELGLQDQYVYVPRHTRSPDGDVPVRLFVPQHAEYAVPDSEALDSHFVVTDDESSRGVSLQPTGGPLLEEFERALTGSLSSDPAVLADQLADGVVEQFELAESVEVEVDAERLTASVTGPLYGPVDQFDHPIASFLGVGTASALDAVVTVETTPAGGDRADYLVACSWSPESMRREPAPAEVR